MSATDQPSAKQTNYCSICNKYYASSKSYGNHVRSYHSKNKEKAQCQYCGNCFTRRDNLQQHVKLFHGPNGIVFPCKFCLKHFKTKYDCKKHQYKCSLGPTKTKLEKHLSSDSVNNESLTVKLPLINDASDDVLSHNKNGLKRSFVYSSSNNSDNEQKKKQISLSPASLYPSYVHQSNNEENDETRDKALSAHHHVTQKQSPHFYNNYLFEGDKYPSSSDHQEYHMKNKNNGKAEISVEEICVEDYNGDHNRALDCTACNITFLTKRDYESHKPYCQEMS